MQRPQFKQSSLFAACLLSIPWLGHSRVHLPQCRQFSFIWGLIRRKEANSAKRRPVGQNVAHQKRGKKHKLDSMIPVNSQGNCPKASRVISWLNNENGAVNRVSAVPEHTLKRKSPSNHNRLRRILFTAPLRLRRCKNFLK